MGPNLLKVIFQTCQLDQNVALPKAFRIWLPFTDEKSQLFLWPATSPPTLFLLPTVLQPPRRSFFFSNTLKSFPPQDLGT